MKFLVIYLFILKMSLSCVPNTSKNSLEDTSLEEAQSAQSSAVVGSTSCSSQDMTYYINCRYGIATNNASSSALPINNFTNLKNNILPGGRICPGTRILFRRGTTCNETLNISLHNGSSASRPVTFGSYGSLSDYKPAISGASSFTVNQLVPIISPTQGGVLLNHLTSTTTTNAKIYRLDAGNLSDVRQVFLNGVALPISSLEQRCSTPSNSNRVLEHRGDGLASFSGDQVTWIKPSNPIIFQYPVATGSQLITRAAPWWYSRKNFSKNNSTQRLNFGTPIVPPGSAHNEPKMYFRGFKYDIINSLAYADCAREWYYNPHEKKVYINLAGLSLGANDRIELSHRSYGISADLSNHGHLIVDGLKFNHQSRTAIRVVNSKRLTVRNVHINSPGTYGIKVWGNGPSSNYINQSVNILDNQINSAGEDGIRVSGSQLIDISRNKVLHNRTIKLQPASETPYFLAGSGIKAENFATAKIEENETFRTGWGGIAITGYFKNADIKHNRIDRYCLLINDCFGIGLNGDNQDMTGLINIQNNTILEGKPEITGVKIHPQFQKRLASAIYLDWGASNTRVNNNRILRARSLRGAIHIHGGSNNWIERNTINNIELTSSSFPSYPNIHVGYMWNPSQSHLPMSGNRIRYNHLSMNNTQYGNIQMRKNNYNGEPAGFSLAWIHGNQMINTGASGALLYYILNSSYTHWTNGGNQMFNGVSVGNNGAGTVINLFSP